MEDDSVIAHKFAVMQQQLEQKDKRIKELKEVVETKQKFIIMASEVIENSIPKQVVKDKIEEIIIDKGNRYYDKFLESRDIQYTIDILRELLRGEK